MEKGHLDLCFANPQSHCGVRFQETGGRGPDAANSASTIAWKVVSLATAQEGGATRQISLLWRLSPTLGTGLVWGAHSIRATFLLCSIFRYSSADGAAMEGEYAGTMKLFLIDFQFPKLMSYRQFSLNPNRRRRSSITHVMYTRHYDEICAA